VTENWGGINEWRSTYVRLRQFEAGLAAQRESSSTKMRGLALAGGGSGAESELSPMVCDGDAVRKRRSGW
jgi:hypothetical protein